MALLPCWSYYIVLFFFISGNFVLLSFLAIAMYANDVETKENNNYMR